MECNRAVLLCIQDIYPRGTVLVSIVIIVAIS